MITLRGYQQRGVDELRGLYRQGRRAPLYVLPTGGGKTAVFSHIATSAAARGNSVFILVHRQELLMQASRQLDGLGLQHGLIAPGHTQVHSAVQVASVQTLARRIKKFRYRPDLIIIDEAHHAVAGTWARLIEEFQGARLLGVTATPCRTDGRGLGAAAGGVFDGLVLGPAISDLIGDGYLTPPRVYAPLANIDMTGVRTSGGDWNRQQVAERMDKPVITGDAVQHYSRICPGQPAIAFCANVTHSEHVAAAFRAAGYRAYSIDGSMPDARRRALIQGLADGSVQVLTSCDIISEGTDIPVVTAAILLRPTQSLALFLQQVGRVLRPVYAPGYDLGSADGRLAAIAAGPKPHAIILDHVGNTLTHGLPDDDREWTLDGKERKRRKKADQDPPVNVRQCEQCFAVHKPAPACPVCGFTYPAPERQPEQVDGELSEVTPEQRAQLRRQQRAEEAQCKTLEDFERLAAARGYKPGWARIRYQLRQRRMRGVA